MKEQLHYDIKKAGAVSSLPYFLNCFVSVLNGKIADHLISRWASSVRVVRLLLQLVGYTITGSLLVLTGFLDSKTFAAAAISARYIDYIAHAA
jgi:hypothetical protein